MENKYVKQFPDLMAGKKVMYVHGFGSSAQTGTVGRLRKVLCNATVIAEDMPLHPQEAIDLLHRLCEEEQPDLIIGTSMGGMYTEQLYGYDRIVINPAFCIADTMQQHGLTGAQTYFNPRKDGMQKFFVDNNIVKEYRLVSEQRFSGVNDEERKRVWDSSAMPTPSSTPGTSSVSTTPPPSTSMESIKWTTAPTCTP